MLQSLKAANFRNFTTVNFQPGESFNLIYGQNGSGKTSILEAIYFLGMGRSFRSKAHQAIAYAAERFTLFGSIMGAEGLPTSVGIEKTQRGKARIKIENEEAISLVDLAKAIPLLLITPESYRLLNTGPQAKRQFLDWGVFHVEHSFFPQWRRYQRALKQRNSALQQGLPTNSIRIWDDELVSAGEAITELRKNYAEQLIATILGLLQRPDSEGIELTIDFVPGWDQQLSLKAALDNAFVRDRALGYTHIGPHRASLDVKVHGVPAQEVLSRGEQKQLICTLLLAQGLLFRQVTNRHCVYLLDDIGAELDTIRWQELINILMQLESQVFVTAVDKQAFADIRFSSSKMFHVEHGTVREG